MANTLTPLDLANMTLALLGESAITSFTESTNKARVLNLHYATARDAVLRDHFWNFATVRTQLAAYTEPAGTLTPGATTGSTTFTTSGTGVFGLNAVGQVLIHTAGAGEATITALSTSTPAATLTPGSGALTPETAGVTFTASAAVFGAGDVGKILENLSGNGAATITAQGGTTVTATILEAFDSLSVIASGSWRLVRTDLVTALISEDFPGVGAIASGDWQLWNQAPDYDFTQTLTMPTDVLRIQRVESSKTYQVEGDFLLAYESTLNLLYTRRVTDVTRFPPDFVQCLVAHLAAMVAEPITGQADKAQLMERKYEWLLKRAKKSDGQEGTPPRLQANELALARRTKSVSGVTDEWR